MLVVAFNVLPIEANLEVVIVPDEYSSIQDVVSFPFAYSLERSVIIGNSAYVARLYLWRMVW